MHGGVHHRQRSSHTASPKYYPSNFELLPNVLNHAIDVSCLLLSVGQVLPLAFATGCKVKGNEIDLWRNELSGFHFMSSIAMQIKDCGESVEIIRKCDAGKVLLLLVEHSEQFEERRATPVLALDCIG